MNVIHQVFFLPIKLTHEAAKVPTQEIGNVGFDVYSVEEVILSPGKITRVNLGFQFADAVEPMTLSQKTLVTLSQKTLATSFMKIEGRSGLACNGIFPVGGIIDPSYRGDVKAIMFNSTE
jgi:dUTPase